MHMDVYGVDGVMSHDLMDVEDIVNIVPKYVTFDVWTKSSPQTTNCLSACCVS